MALTTNLVSYWKLDESSGNAADATGNGNTLTNNNAAAYGSSYGKINNGIYLNSASSQFLNGSSSIIPTSGSWTVSMWVNEQSRVSNADPAYTHILFWQGTAEIASNNGVLYTVISGSWTSTGYTLSLATWTHLVFVYDSSTGNFTVYANGTSQYTSSGGGQTGGANTFDIGVWQNGTGSPPRGYTNCYFDEVGIWSRALTSTEVSTLYNGGAGLQYPFVVASTSNAPFFLKMVTQ